MRRTVQKNCKMAAPTQPSLKALRTFEAAARLESLTLAARELHVSVSAVRFQVRQVEESLGQKLLCRQGRGLVATEAGKALSRDLAGAFASIQGSVARLRRGPARAITVSMLPSFAALWLLPRLPDFRREHPDYDVRILTSERIVNLRAEQVDLAIRCGPGGWPGVRAEPVFPQLLAPVCRPGHPAARADLLGLPDEEMIVNARHLHEWPDWFAAQAIRRPAPAGGQLLDGRELVAEAVRAGLGVGLMDVSIFARELRAGDLVQLGPAMPTGWTHYLVAPQDGPMSTPAGKFREWLLACVAVEG